MIDEIRPASAGTCTTDYNENGTLLTDAIAVARATTPTRSEHLPGFSVLPGVPGEAAECMFERRGHGQLLKKFGSYPDGRLPSGKKEKADANVSLSIIHSTSEWLERKYGRSLGDRLEVDAQ